MADRNYYPLKVSSVKKLTPNSVGVSFELPSELKETFAFTQGQYLSLRKNINGEDVIRSYSIYSSPSEGKWEVGIKKVEGGKFSTYANESLKAGDIIDVMPPQGRFYCPIEPNAEKKYVIFTAGSGVTPIFSNIKAILEKEPHSRILLFYGNQKTETIMFKEALEDLKNIHLGRLSIFHLLSKEIPSAPLFNGRINTEKLDQFIGRFFNLGEVSHYMLCGPAQMIMSVKEHLITLGEDPKKIHFELFSTEGLENIKESQIEEVEIDRTKESKIRIQLDGDQFEFNLAYGGQNILDAALENGADLPFACKGGVCCTCRAKVVEGEVSMDVNYALEPDEVEAGFVLTCQSHPRTEFVEIDFDTK